MANMVKGVGFEPTMLTFRSRFTVCRNTTVVAVPPEIWCERWDSNPHATRTSASKADTYRQFRHSRIVILFRYHSLEGLTLARYYLITGSVYLSSKLYIHKSLTVLSTKLITVIFNAMTGDQFFTPYWQG